MATVVITFFLFARLYVYKMDADWIDSQRDQFLARREKRWSMNSQRLEEIVAELMKPISDDGRRSFDTDLSSLLEEYLTEAGLHALDAAEAGEEDCDLAVPNFAEIALLLQQSANIYGRKVDFLYKHVLQVSDTLHNSVQELANTGTTDEPQTPTSSRRKRKLSAHSEFTEIELEACGHAARDAEAPRPPPTLPRMYIELEPRVMTAADMPLYDYAADNIGLLTDFQVTWRLQDGMLVDELEGGAARGASTLRPISLLELQAAIAAAAPAELAPSPRAESPPRGASTPLPLDDSGVLPDLACAGDGDGDKPLMPPLMPPPARRERKRRNDVKIDDIFKGNVKIVFGKDLMKKLKEMHEFNVPERWISTIVAKRKSEILNARKKRLHDPQPPDEEETEFLGWSNSEAVLAAAALPALPAPPAPRAPDADSDDDGFFEQSSGGGDVAELESLRADVAGATRAARERPPAELDEAARARRAEAAAWRAAILRRAVAAEARGGVDVRALGARVLRALDGCERRPRPFAALLADHVQHEADVSRLMLTALFLANAGNVEIVQGGPLSLNSFSLRLLSHDQSLCARAAAADQHLLR